MRPERLWGNCGGTVALTDSTVRQNTAEAGGGIYVFFGGVTFDEESQVKKNAADLDGGGIYNDRGAVNLDSADNVVGNSPNNCAGDPVGQCVG